MPLSIDQGEPQLPSEGPQPPPESSRQLMNEAANLMGASVDAVDSDGSNRFSRADGERAEVGPLATTLTDRLIGSSAEVDARGAQEGGGRADAVLHERTGRPAVMTLESTVHGVDPKNQPTTVQPHVLVGAPFEQLAVEPSLLPFRTGELVRPPGPEQLPATISGPAVGS